MQLGRGDYLSALTVGNPTAYASSIKGKSKIPISLSLSLSLPLGYSVYFKAVLRLPKVPFTEDLRDPLSNGFKTQARSVEEWMKSIFADVVRDVNVVAFRYVCIFVT